MLLLLNLILLSWDLSYKMLRRKLGINQIKNKLNWAESSSAWCSTKHSPKRNLSHALFLMEIYIETKATWMWQLHCTYGSAIEEKISNIIPELENIFLPSLPLCCFFLYPAYIISNLQCLPKYLTLQGSTKIQNCGGGQQIQLQLCRFGMKKNKILDQRKRHWKHKFLSRNPAMLPEYFVNTPQPGGAEQSNDSGYCHLSVWS